MVTTDRTSGPGTVGGMWRHLTDLPVADARNIVTLGEGATPLLPVAGATLTRLAVGSLHVKAEHQNPTGSFKDRIASVAASMVVERGLHGAVGTSSGNGGAAIAAYGARAGFPVVLFTVSGIVDGKLQQILAQGGHTHIVRGMGSDGASGLSVAPRIADLAAERGWLAFLTGARFAPEAMQGAETIGMELAEEHPDADVVYAPVGGGGLLGSIWRGYRRTGVTPPRLVGVQPAGCPTLKRAVDGDRSPWAQPVTTSISGLQVAMLFDHGAIDAVVESGGHVTEVDDRAAWSAQRVLAREEGLFVEPAGATALAGLLADVAARRVRPDDDVVVVTSGAGHKDPASAARLADGNTAHDIGPEDITDRIVALTGGGRA